MKLLEVNTVAVGGSIPAYMRAIVDEAHRRGWQVAVAKGRRADMPGVDNIQIGTRLDTAVHGLATRLFDRHGLVGKAATRRFIADAERFDPDIIHLHNIHGYYLHFPTLMQWLAGAGKPVFWSLHDSWAYTGHCAFYTGRGGECSVWRHGCGNCPLRGLYPASFADGSRRNLRAKAAAFNSVPAMTLLPVSDWLKGELKHSVLAGIPAETVKLDVDTDTFRPCGSPRPEVPVVLGVAAKWNPLKGLDFFAELRRHLPAEVEIRIVGKIEGAVPPGINAVGSVEHSALAAHYSRATLVVSASYAENYPQAIREALACGAPVVARNAGGALEDLLGCGAPVAGADTDAALTDAVKNMLARAAAEGPEIRRRARAAAEALYGGAPWMARLFGLFEGAKC